MSKKYSVGIDLGSTHSCIGVFMNNHVNILVDPKTGNTTVPSWVKFTNGSILVGEEAKQNIDTNTIYDVKRLIGRKYSDPEIKDDIENISFKTTPDENDNIRIHSILDNIDTVYYPEEISSYVLSYLKEIAENYVKDEITDVVITVPAYFTDSQRTATKRAACMAGFKNVLRVINEPTAASFAYGMNNKTVNEEYILVMDVGGCTTDISIISIDNGFYEVIGTSGLTHLGGEDFNNDIIRYIKNRCAIDVNNVDIDIKLRDKVEKCKKDLSIDNEVIINMTSISDDIPTFKLTRTKLEECCKDNFDKCLDLVDQALKEAKTDHSKIDKLIMVGGSTSIPYLREKLSEKFNGKEIYKNINPDEAIAYGATIQAALLQGVDNDIINDIVITDVASLSIGVETVGGLMRQIVKKNTIIPCKKSHVFTTFYDGQPTVTIKVYEGERPLVENNHFLGKFNLEGIEDAKKGEPKIEVFFEINADGILKITAVNQKSKNSKSLEVNYTEVKVDKDQLKENLHNADQNKELDELNKKRIKMWYNHVDELNHMKEQLENEHVPREAKEEYEFDIEDLISWYYDHPEASINQMQQQYEHIKDVIEAITQLCNKV